MEEPPLRAATVEPGFDLTAEMGSPALPATEAGTGEPPALSVEDLVSEAEPPQLTLPELELELPAPPAEAPGATPPPPAAEAFAMEPVFEPASPGLEAPVAPLPDLEPLTFPVLGGEAPPPEAPAERPRAEISAPLPGLESEAVLAAGVPESSPSAAPVAPAAPTPPPPAGPEAVASMRDAVTERVARVLARDLSEKLAERIERIVWEVVPEMAELMIAKEIERIRTMADEKHIS
jgi:hypothetical protein